MNRHLGLVAPIPNVRSLSPFFIRTHNRVVPAPESSTFAGLLVIASSGAALAEVSGDFVHQLRLHVQGGSGVLVTSVEQRQYCTWSAEGRAMKVELTFEIFEPAREPDLLDRLGLTTRRFVVRYDGTMTTFDLSDDLASTVDGVSVARGPSFRFSSPESLDPNVENGVYQVSIVDDDGHVCTADDCCPAPSRRRRGGFSEVAGVKLSPLEQAKFDAAVAQADVDTTRCECGQRRMWHFGTGGMGLCHDAVVDVGDANKTGGFQPANPGEYQRDLVRLVGAERELRRLK